MVRSKVFHAEEKLYSQRSIASSQNSLWNADGIPFRSATGTQYNPQIIYDGSNEALYLWVDTKAAVGGNYVCVQKLDSDSAAGQWPTDGVTVVVYYARTDLHAETG